MAAVDEDAPPQERLLRFRMTLTLKTVAAETAAQVDAAAPTADGSAAGDAGIRSLQRLLVRCCSPDPPSCMPCAMRLP